ncbi:MAG: hypothetical protein ACOC5E_01405, partial [Acidobacteriota bacterium]
ALLLAGGAAAQEQEQEGQRPRAGVEQTEPELEWPGRVSELPVVDLSGTWVFDPEISDPMVDAWRGRRVEYRVEQQSDFIRLEFRPEDGQGNNQTYRWNGRVIAFERGSTEVRELAAWVDGGRVLEVVGRWWSPEDITDIHSYTFRYSLQGFDVLVLEQVDPHGSTTWRFQRAEGD